MEIRNDVQPVIGGILKGEILETFDRYYADDMSRAITAAANASARPRSEGWA